MTYQEWIKKNGFENFEYLHWGKFVWNEALKHGGCARDQKTTQYCAEVLKLLEENEELRSRLFNLEASRDYVQTYSDE